MTLTAQTSPKPPTRSSGNMTTYSILGPDGWERFDDREAWRERSLELMRNRDMSQYTGEAEVDAMEW